MFGLPVSERILRSIAELDRFRGRWGGTVSAPPAVLERLSETARVQSIAASCRMAGIRIAEAEVEEVLRDPGSSHRERESIRGLAAALAWRPPVSEPLLSAEVLGRLNAVVLGDLSAEPQPLPWRDRHVSREAFSSDGTAMGRVFPTLPPRMLPEKMEQALTWLELGVRDREQHPLLVIGTFLLAFLAAHPFARGSGRTGRVLVLRLVDRAGYRYVDYASLERVFEETRDNYYDAFDRSETRLWLGEANLEPWLDYFLGALIEQAGRLRQAVAFENRALDLSPLQQQVLRTLREHGTANASLLLATTGANRHTLKDNMRRLVGMGLVDKTGERRATRYRLGQGAVAEGLPSGPGDGGLDD